MGNTIQDWTYDNHVPSKPDVCAEITVVIVNQLEKLGWSNKDVFGIHMALEEALMNAIRHGNLCSPDKQVHVEITICTDVFTATITDEGAGFNPEDLPDPTEDENVEKSCGRGVMLMKNFVDEVIYNQKGNSVQIKKNKSK